MVHGRRKHTFLVVVRGVTEVRPPGGGVGRYPDRKEPAGETRLLRPQKVEVAVVTPLEEASGAAPCRVEVRLEERQQDIVVAVKDLQVSRLGINAVRHHLLPPTATPIDAQV
jgi:hypothetical protein